jgi:hypothetical protein
MVFDEPIFDQLAEEERALSEQWSVWKQPMPVILRHQIVTNFVPTALPIAPPHAPIVYPIRQTDQPKTTVDTSRAVWVQEPHHPRVVTEQRYRVRRFFACIALGAVLFAGLSGASAIASTHQGAPVVLAGMTKAIGGYEYSVKAGDTLWSIASRVYPNGDPRALVSRLEVDTHGAPLTPGERLLLP